MNSFQKPQLQSSFVHPFLRLCNCCFIQTFLHCFKKLFLLYVLLDLFAGFHLLNWAKFCDISPFKTPGDLLTVNSIIIIASGDVKIGTSFFFSCLVMKKNTLFLSVPFFSAWFLKIVRASGSSYGSHGFNAGRICR